ncbi:hypothetical protein J5N97_001653 [Dioscorea zingiberensis]|uniref:Exopolygalacturonase n=1 Tax=Dioscorea zingiberensis TaxID=325984 RepID=A0A9D5BTA6_9LILI|nr:hypothetical protein J5N97_001653 [Dioscorea zingiberensis]
MSHPNNFSLLLSITTALLLLIIQALHPVKANYNIMSYGAKSDGQSDSSGPISSAWQAACMSTGSSTIYIPSGTFMLKPITLNGPCTSNKIIIQIDGTLVAPSSYSTAIQQWIMFKQVDGVSIYGGTINGQGQTLWSCKSSKEWILIVLFLILKSLIFSNSKNIMISGLTSINSELYHIAINGCEGVQVQGVKISAPGNSPNTDGIHVQMSTNVTITGTGIKTGDDCVSIGPGTTDLWIERVTCGPGHGISIGSLGKDKEEKGVQNVIVKNTVFTGSQNGLRIKTWGRPSDGFVKGVVFEHALMQNVQNPIIIDQNYCPHNDGCPDQNSGVKISGVTYNDIQGSSATQVAMNFDCSPSNPCSGIVLEDIKLTYGDKLAESSCKNVDGTASGLVVPPSCL